tara:strand:+ start:34 stop:342 length:309 start_codon:yes stop_codon:yes gene_type:complete
MFDANLRHLPKGYEFFAYVWTCEKVNKYNFKKDDVILCTMLDEDNKDPRVTLHLKSGDVTITHRDDFYEWNLVYAGAKDLTGFLPQEEHYRQKAKKLLEEMK